MKLHFLLPCAVLMGCAPAVQQLAQSAPQAPAAVIPASATAPAPPIKPTFPTVSAQELQKAWESDREAVAAKYDGKTIAVTGMIADMKKSSAADGYYVTFLDPRGYFANGMEVRGAGWWLIDVICYFDRREQLKELDQHQPVKVVGQVKIDDRIRLVHCQVEKAFNPAAPQPGPE